MKILIIGIPYFAAKIRKNLTDIDKSNVYVSVDIGAGLIQRLRYIWNLCSAQTVYLIGGTTRRRMALDLALTLRKPVVMHWVGTDALLASVDYENGQTNEEIKKYTRHLCEAKWIKDELSIIGIEADIVQIASFDTDTLPLMPLPDKFSILSYMIKGREKFYGIDKLILVAEKFPHIPIRITGIDRYHEPLPENIILLGTVPDMLSEIASCVLYLRLPEHDGLSFSVLEALALGRYVGYCYDLPGSQKLISEQDLLRFVSMLEDLHHRKLLEINQEGRQFIEKNYGKRFVMERLVEKLRGST